MLTQDVKQKIDSAFNNYNSFIGNLIFEDYEKNQIYDEVSEIFKGIVKEYGAKIKECDYKIVTIAVVELSKEWGESSDEDAWSEYILKHLVGSQSQTYSKIYNNICCCLDKLSKNNSFFMFECFQKKYYTSICCHSFSPKKSMDSLFNMCWEIYCKDLSETYSHDNSLLKLIASNLKNRLSFEKTNINDDKNIEIGSKVYDFRANVKGLIKDYPDLLIELLDRTFSCIHSFMNSEPIKIDTYFNKLIKEWWNEKSSSFGILKSKINKRYEFIATDYSQIKLKYILVDKKVKLVVFPFRLNKYSDVEPCIKVVINGKVIKEETIPITGSGIIMTTKKMSYDFDSLSSEINNDIVVQIIHLEDEIYNSKNTLQRDFILFKENNEVISQNLVPGIYFIFTNDTSYIQGLTDRKKIDNNLYSFKAIEGESICSKNRAIFFENEKNNNDLFFLLSEKKNIYYAKNGINYKIIDGDLRLNISKDYDLNDLGVKFGEDCIFKLKDFQYSENENRKEFNLSQPINDMEPMYISVFKYSNNTIINAINIIKFDNLLIEYDKQVYYGDGFGEITFKFGNNIIKKSFSINEEENSFSLNGKIEGEVIFYPPKIKWRLGEENWETKPSKPFYFKKITDSTLLEIDKPLDLDCVVELENGRKIEQIKDKQMYKIGQTLHSLTNDSVENVVVYVSSEREKFKVAEIYLKSKILDDFIYVNSEKYEIEYNPEFFIGEDDAILEMRIMNRGNIAFKSELNLKFYNKNKIKLDLNEDRYSISILLKSNNVFRKDPFDLLYNKKCILGNEKNLKYKNTSFKIVSVINFDNSTIKIKNPIFIDKIKFKCNINGFDIYSGSLYQYNSEKEKEYIDFIETKKSIVKINPIRIEIKSEQKGMMSCYLQYGLDKKDPREFDSEFVLSNDDEIVIEQERNSASCNIDFYNLIII